MKIVCGFPEYETQRLFLRKMQLADAETLLRFWSDQQVAKYMRVPELEAIEQVQAIIKTIDNKNLFRWSIVRKNDDMIIGTCGYDSWDKPNHRGEIAFDLGREFWGQGFMSEALGAIIFCQGFNQMKLERIQALTAKYDKPSRKLLMMLGFQEEGVLRNYDHSKGRPRDIVIFSLLKSDLNDMS